MYDAAIPAISIPDTTSWTGFANIDWQNIGKDPYKDKGLVNPAGGRADIATELLRAQFKDWQATFQPIELAAINQLSFNNPDILPAAVNTAKETTAKTFGTMRGALDRQNAALGVIPTEQQQRVGKRLINLSEASATAGAANTARENVREQDEALILGAAPNPNILKGTV